MPTPKHDPELVTLDHWIRYVRVQRSGRWNMLDPRAQIAARLPDEVYLAIIENYAELEKEFQELGVEDLI